MKTPTPGVWWRSKGFPVLIGKKDKYTREQAYFTCNVCDCDLKSMKLLRILCKEKQPMAKALQKKNEWKNENPRVSL